MEAPRIVGDGIDVRRLSSRGADGLLRLAALLIDLAPIVAAFYLAGGLYEALPFLGIGQHLGPLRVMDGPLSLAVGACGPCLYFALMECSPVQGTLGKYLFGLEVTDRAGHRIGPARSLLRTLSKAAYLWCIPLVLISFGLTNSTRRRAIHDLLAGTFVLRRDPILRDGPPPRPPDDARPAPATPAEGITPARENVRE